MQKRAFFFDRDGVINQLIDNRPPWSLSEVVFYPEIKGIVDTVSKSGFIPIVVTNQPDARREIQSISESAITSINQYIVSFVGIDYSYICLHPWDGMCNCRKPKPGMLLQAAKELRLSLRDSFLLGDRAKDVAAGKAAGCTTIHLLSTGEVLSPIADFHASDHSHLTTILPSILDRV